jgi:hypothetical protein
VTICLDLAAQLGLLLLHYAVSASAEHAVQYPPTGLLLSACLVFILFKWILHCCRCCSWAQAGTRDLQQLIERQSIIVVGCFVLCVVAGVCCKLLL